ncbi:MAG: L-ribulose-5-phosphate 4-epimerase [Bryobacteraceae bacterium]|nr:L-ribulose-5-phosphate 4-epimerase [Bryobacteraceae bacterium]
MLERLREEVLEANLEVVRRGLVLYTFGNASGIDRERGLVVIKPSGVDYDRLKPADMVIVDLDGRPVEGGLRPSSDLATHIVLYKAFPAIGGVVHTHSRAATCWAQANRGIPCFGTTHADYFYGEIPVTAPLSEDEIRNKYEENTGHAIVRRFAGIEPLEMPGVLVSGHAPFAWGKTAEDAAHNAVLLEEVAVLALQTVAVNLAATPIPQALLDKHFLRKHGSAAYYGQVKS